MENIHLVRDILIAVKTELIRFRALAAILFSLILLAAIGLAVKWPKYYVSSAVIVMDNTNVIEPLLRGAAETANDKNENVEGVIYSRRLLEKVYAVLNPDYETADPKDIQAGIANLRGGLSVERVKGMKGATRISFQANTADESFEKLSVIVEVFITDSHEAKKRDSYSAYNFISEQVENYKKRLEQADQNLKEFRARNVDATDESVKRRISDLTAEIQNLKIAINESQQKIQTTRSQIREERELVSVRGRYSDLQQRKSLLTDQLDQLRLMYQDSYPDIVTIKRQIAEIDNQLYDLTAGQDLRNSTESDLPLLEELRKQLSSAQVELTTQNRRLTSLEELLEMEYAKAEQVATNQAELADLMRDYDVTKKHYEQMLSRKENSTLTLALNDQGQGTSYRVVEPPFYPLEPAGLRALYIYLAAPVLALCAPIGLAAVFVILDPRMRSHTLLIQKIPEGVDVLAKVPHRGSPLATRLLRKDMVLLGIMAILLCGIYIYGLNQYSEIL